MRRLSLGPSQLCINRSMGTIDVPIGFGAPPELTVYELTREG